MMFSLNLYGATHRPVPTRVEFLRFDTNLPRREAPYLELHTFVEVVNARNADRESYMRKLYILGAATFASVALMAGAPAQAAGFPDHNITFIIPYGPGGGFDTYVRRIAPIMQKYLPNKVNVLPRNEPGAGGRKMLIDLWRSKPDGYKIGIFNMPGMMLDKVLGKKDPYKIEKFTWLGRVAESRYVLTVATKSSYNSLADLKKAKELKYPVTSTASGAYVAGKIMAHAIGLHVKFLTGYKGSAKASLSIIRGDTDLSLFNTRSFAKWAKGGDLKGLVSFEEKSSFKGMPTVAQVGYPSLEELTIERVVGTTPGIPGHVRKILASALLKALRSPTMQAWHKKTGRPLNPLGADGTAKVLKSRLKFMEKYKNILRAHG